MCRYFHISKARYNGPVIPTLGAMDTSSLNLETMIGRIRFSAERSGDCLAKLSVRKVTPLLPDGMSITRARAVLLEAEPCVHESSLQFNCCIESAVTGSPCTGEALEAQEWESKNNLVVIGTEDAEFLNRRLPFLGLAEYENIVRYKPNSMAITLKKVPKGVAISLHFVVAENTYPEPVECSAWFAVDMSHKSLFES